MNYFWKNPVNIKELRQRFRTHKTIWMMGSYLLVVGTILLGFIYISVMDQQHFMPGEYRVYFMAFSVLQIVLIAFMAPGLSAGTISGERERQTLDILLTTQLTPLSIVLSKLLTSLAFIGLLVFMSLPLYSFVFLFGGVSPEEVIKVFLFYAVNIFFFGSLGLFCSTWIKRTGVSTVTAYGITFIVGVGTALLFYFLYSLITYVQPGADVQQFLSLSIIYSLNPIFALFDVFNEGVLTFEHVLSPWVFYSIVYTAISIGLIFWSAYLLQPVRKIRWKT